jgi:hypothetical protein
MNYPVITDCSLRGTHLTITGYVGSAASQTTFAGASIDVYEALDDNNQNGAIIAGDGKSVGHGEGYNYLGTITADAQGNFDVEFDVRRGKKGLMVGDKLTVTATDAGGNTSEFGANFTVTK